MSLPSLFATIFAQAASTAATTTTGTATDPSAQGQGAPGSTLIFYFLLIGGMIYFGVLRPQQQAKKKADETIKGAKTGDKIVTTGGIHGSITNVKDTTVILKIADNVKIEIEKTSIDKITRPDNTSPAPEKIAATKA